MLLLLSAVLVAGIIGQVSGHGRLVNPPGRSTMWRYGFNTPANTNDHQLSCGGFGTQFYRNGGKCGICGDPWNANPRDNEAGGKFATGTIAKTYKQGETITAEVQVTVNHGGWFEFRLCPNNNPKKAATEQCLNENLLRLPGGEERFTLPPGLGTFPVQLVLPRGLTCTQCVLQWKWNTASNVHCEGGTCCRGCGPQEQFYGCADIAITGSGNSGSQHHVSTSNGGNTGVEPIGGNSFGQGGFIPNNKPNTFPVAIKPNTSPIDPNPRPNSLPDGILPVPVGDLGIGIGIGMCEATPQWRAMYPGADRWCRTHCPLGNCPINLCSRVCQPVG